MFVCVVDVFVCVVDSAVEVQLGKEAQEEQQQGSEELRSRLEQAEKLNKHYERNLKENAGHMLAVIEKMQKMVDQVRRGPGSLNRK